jgi:hypothetical protein
VTLADLVNAAVIAAFCAPLLLIAVYSVVAPWHRSRLGRTLVTVKAAISLALLPPFAYRVTGSTAPPSPGFQTFQAVTWGILALVLLRMTWVIIATQRQGIREARGAMSAEAEKRAP